MESELTGLRWGLLLLAALCMSALMPDAEGRVWFTSKYGIIGVVDVDHSRA